MTENNELLGNDEEPTTNSENARRRQAERRRKLLEAQEFQLSPEEIEKRKREATETEFQEEND